MDLKELRSGAAELIGRGRDYARRGVALAKAKGKSMIPFLLTPLGRLAASAAIVLIAWLTFAKHYENKGASRVTAHIEKKVAENVKKAEAARRSGAGLPVDCLQRTYCRD